MSFWQGCGLARKGCSIPSRPLLRTIGGAGIVLSPPTSSHVGVLHSATSTLYAYGTSCHGQAPRVVVVSFLQPPRLPQGSSQKHARLVVQHLRRTRPYLNPVCCVPPSRAVLFALSMLGELSWLGFLLLYRQVRAQVHRVAPAEIHRGVRDVPDVPQPQHNPHQRPRVETLLRALPGWQKRGFPFYLSFLLFSRFWLPCRCTRDAVALVCAEPCRFGGAFFFYCV